MSTKTTNRPTQHLPDNHGEYQPPKRGFEPHYGEQWELKSNSIHALHFDRFLTPDEVERWVTKGKNPTVKSLPHTVAFDVSPDKHQVMYARFRNTRDFYMVVTDINGARGNSARILLDLVTLKDKVLEVWGMIRDGQWIINFGVESVAPMVMHPGVASALLQERVAPVPTPVVPVAKLGDIFEQALAKRKAAVGG